MNNTNWKTGCLLLALCWIGGMCNVLLAQAILQHLSWR